MNERRPGGRPGRSSAPPVLRGCHAATGRIDRLLAAARAGSSAVIVVEGRPGVGKTALLEHCRAVASSAGMRLLRATGHEAESRVAFAGLHALLRPALDTVRTLPARQAEALGTALGSVAGPSPDPLLVGAATLGVWAAEASGRPLAVIVDDAHWLDRTSADAIAFAARRLLAEPVAVVIATRTDETSPAAALPAERITLGAMDLRAAREMLEDRLPGRVARRDVERLHQLTGGNALAMIELAAAGADAWADEAGAPALPLSSRLTEALLRPVAALSADGRAAAELAAMCAGADLRVLRDAAGAVGVPFEALQEAEDAGVLRLDGEGLAFDHPLRRSAVATAVPPGRARGLRRALAGAVDPRRDPERHAWFLAAAALGPDERAASALDVAAGHASGRGAPAAATAALRRAAELSTDHRRRGVRLAAAAEAAWQCGDADAARALSAAALDGPLDRRARLRTLRLRGMIVARTGPAMDGYRLLVEAADAAAPGDADLAAAMLAEAADLCIYAGRPEPMLTAARRAVALLDDGADEADRAAVELAHGSALVFSGDRAGLEILRRATDVLADGAGGRGTLTRVAQAPLWLREVACPYLSIALQGARRRGDAGALPQTLFLAARDAAVEDRWTLAERLYAESAELAAEAGQESCRCAALAGRAWVAARRGDEGARASADEALRLADGLGLGLFRVWVMWALGDLDMALGSPEAARARFAELEDLLDDLGIGDPDLAPGPEVVELDLALGRQESAQAVADRFWRRARDKDRPWTLARGLRARALVAEGGEMERLFAVSLAADAEAPDTFDAARTHLLFGERLRRARRRVRAREHLRRAMSAFAALGAVPWADRARRELAASGETARRRDPAAEDRLTPQELRVATLLADGATTREAATRLFLSPKTVEFHLRNAYRKLGLRSRKELAAALDPRAAET